MSDIEKILKAIAESNDASEKRHCETKSAVREVANEQIKANKRLDALEDIVKSHGRKFEHANHGIRQASESDATLASNLAVVATAGAQTATELRSVSERMTKLETSVAAVPAATANATALATKGENDRLQKKIQLHPWIQALAVFIGTAFAAAAVQIIKSMMGGH